MGCSFNLTASQKTLIGIMIIKFATGFTGDWGVISIYILSYYYFAGAPVQIKASTNSLMMILMVIPATMCLLIATRIAKKVGNDRLIRLCGLVYTITPLISFFSFKFQVFLICNIIIPFSVFALALIPIFHCLYSHFGNNKSLATGAVICSFGLGAIIWDIVATLAINPDNIVPDIMTEDRNLQFFQINIASRVPKTMNYIFLVSGILFIGGSQLISANEDYKEQVPHQILQSQNQGKQLEDKTNQRQPALEDYSQQQKIQISKYLKHPIVILLFLMNVSGCLYQVYVQLNTKLVYMSTLEDDHLISIGLILIILSSAIFSVPWGLLADRKGPPTTIITFIIIDLAVKIFASLARSKKGFVISMILIGATDKTMLVLFAPILIDSFGLHVATELLPFKGISGIFSVVISAGLGLLFEGVAPQRALYIISLFSFLNLFLGFYLAYIIKNQEQSRKERVKSIL